jgi:hypothetical protein
MAPAHLLSEDDYLAREAGRQGLCLACRGWTGGIDPGAAASECPACGERDVHGVEQALLLGLIGIRR